MVKLRKFSAYWSLERPYTRFSKYKKHNFVRGRPVCRIARFNTGTLTKHFPFTVELNAKLGVQVRDNAIESARQTCVRFLEKNFGKSGYQFRVRLYPHHVLRENPLASGAGADRMSTGMKKSFGKPIGRAAQLRPGQIIFSMECSEEKLKVAREAMRKASMKLPVKCAIKVVKTKESLLNKK